MRHTAVLTAALGLAVLGAGGAQAQSGDPDRIERQEALRHAAAIENAFRSVEARIGVTDADDLWEDEWDGASHPPAGSWWLSSWTDRGLSARYCSGILAVFADGDELKGVGRDQRAVQVASVAYGNARSGLHIVTRNSRIYEGAHGRVDGSLPACMPILSTTGERVALVSAVADPKATPTGLRWDTENRTVACAAPDTGTFVERRRIPIQVTAVGNCPANDPTCNDLNELMGSPPAWPQDCAERETMLSTDPPGLPANAACSDWVRWRSSCQIVYAAAPAPEDIPDATVTWETGPEHTWTQPCSCSCPSGQTASGSCTQYWAQNTEIRVFVLRPGSAPVRTRQPARVNGQPRLVNTASSCSCTTPPPPTCPPGQVGTPPNCTTPPQNPPQTPTNPQNPSNPQTPTIPQNPSNPQTPTNPQNPPDDDPGGDPGDGNDGNDNDDGDNNNNNNDDETLDTVDHIGAPEDPDVGNGGGGGKPIVLDLDGDGVELSALEDSAAFYDINGDGYRERMGWVAADDGFLAYDRNGDGKIAEHDELSFVSYMPGARTDLEGLRHFDTDGDGQLDPGDAEWDRFRVWQDLDQDGESDPGELSSLDDAGIESISLTSDGVKRTVAGNTVYGEGEYVGPHGPAAFWDVSLRVGERLE